MESIKGSPILNRKPITAGYTKRGELATEEDAVMLGLHPSESEKIFICDRDLNFAMFHFRDFEVKYPLVRDTFHNERRQERSISPNFSGHMLNSYSVENLLPADLFSSSPSPPPHSLTASTETTNQNSDSPKDTKKRTADDYLLVRGWIVDIDKNVVVCRSFSESSVVFVEPQDFLTDRQWEGYVFKSFKEGTTIRIFWDQVQWRFSTHRKIDASNSRIPGVEIEISKIFAEACPNFSYDLLSKDTIYVLQIVHRDNQIMNPEPVEVPYVCHLASITAINTEKPMQLLPLDTDPSLRLECFTYLEPLTREMATDFLQQKKCIIAQRGYEIIQIAPQSMAKLMEIRGHDKAPYIPTALMYLRLSEEDRPFLVDAVPHHLKPLVTTEVMQAYIQENTHKLAHFCACALQAKLFAEGLPLTKTLKWLVDGVSLANKRATFEEIYALYKTKIDKLVATNGVSAYRCFRDVEAVSAKLFKLAAKHEVSTQEVLPATEEAIVDDFINDTRKVNFNSVNKKPYRRPKVGVAAKAPKKSSAVKKASKKPQEKRAPKKPTEKKPVQEKKAPPKPSAKGIDRKILKKEYIIGADPDDDIAEALVTPSLKAVRPFGPERGGCAPPL